MAIQTANVASFLDAVFELLGADGDTPQPRGWSPPVQPRYDRPTPEERLADLNAENRRHVLGIVRDLLVAVPYVYERDRTLEQIQAEHGLTDSGLQLVLENLGLKADRVQAH